MHARGRRPVAASFTHGIMGVHCTHKPTTAHYQLRHLVLQQQHVKS